MFWLYKELLLELKVSIFGCNEILFSIFYWGLKCIEPQIMHSLIHFISIKWIVYNIYNMALSLFIKARMDHAVKTKSHHELMIFFSELIRHSHISLVGLDKHCVILIYQGSERNTRIFLSEHWQMHSSTSIKETENAQSLLSISPRKSLFSLLEKEVTFCFQIFSM